MKDSEVIKIAHLRHQTMLAGDALFAVNEVTDMESFVQRLSKAKVEVSNLFDMQAVQDLISEVGPSILKTIVEYEGQSAKMLEFASVYPEIEDLWVSCVVNVGAHMFYLGILSEKIKQEEVEEMKNKFENLLKKIQDGERNARNKEED